MKYIRTKDGEIRIVIDPNEFDEEERRKIPDNCTMVEANNIYGCLIVENKNIIKQADTIEELVDAWVFEEIEENNHFYSGRYFKLFLKETVLSFLKDKVYDNAYASIWVDGNLLKVAKLNEKGELELL